MLATWFLLAILIYLVNFYGHQTVSPSRFSQSYSSSSIMASPAKKSKEELVLDLSVKYRRSNPSKNFLSEPMLNYIVKNASQKAYYKLIQISKYFFINQPPQVKMFEDSYINDDEDLHPYGISEVSGNRLWINTKDFTWKCSSVSVNGFLQRCFRINLTTLELKKQKVTYDELKLLMDGGKIFWLKLKQCEIMHSNGEEVAIEDILKMTPLLTDLYYKPCEKFTFSSEKVAGLPKFYHLDSINLKGIDEDFCCKAFRNFLKKAPKVTAGQFKFDDVEPRYLREFLITVLQEVDPDFEVNCSDQTISFTELYKEW